MEKKKRSNSQGLGNALSKVEYFFEKNKKTLSIVFIAILVIVGIFVGYKEFYIKPQDKQASEEIFAAQNWFAMDSLNLALNGNPKYKGFIAVADEYSHTKTGNLAKYYAGICYLRKGEFQNAIDYLEKYNGKDLFTSSLVEANLGNAYLELGETNKAISHYEKAATIKENEITTPYTLMKLGIAYEIANEFTKAVDTYKRLKTHYPMSQEARDIDKYIAHAEGLAKN